MDRMGLFAWYLIKGPVLTIDIWTSYKLKLLVIVFKLWHICCVANFLTYDMLQLVNNRLKALPAGDL